MQGSTKQTELSYESICSTLVPFPALQVQRELGEFAKRQSSIINSMLDQIGNLREFLAERRAALISDVVTGRKQV